MRFLRLVMVGAATLLFVTASPLCAEDGQTPKKTNVVVIVADDLGLQLGCYGDTQSRTPHLDAFAKGATRFDRAYCTTASCSASRSVILTGLYNHATGHYGHAHADGHFSTYESVRSLPILMREAGYRTCSIGKLHITPEYVYAFDTYANAGTQGARNTVRMAKNAHEWIAQESNKPFFLYFCPTDPHRGAGPGGFSNFPDKPDYYPGVKREVFSTGSLTPPGWLPQEPEVRGEWSEFLTSINRLDQGMGVLFAALKETGHWDDTLILFLSDNGPPFPGAKTTLYEPGSRLPLLVKAPEQTNGATTNACVTWADLTPTVLDVCGVTPPPGAPLRAVENVGHRITEGRAPWKPHGRSFAPVLASPVTTPEGWDEIYLSHTFHEVQMYYPMRTIISGRYKCIFNIAYGLPYPFASDLFASPTWQGSLRRKDVRYGLRETKAYLHRPRFELYDLTNDPGELVNLAELPAHADALKVLQEKLKAWQTQTKDPWVTKWEYE